MATIPSAAGPSAEGRVLTFRVGDQTFALAADRVREVVRIPRLSRVPHAPASLLGLANVRGSVLSVMSVARLLGRPDGVPMRMIVYDEGEVFGLAVEEARQVLTAGQLEAVGVLDVAGLIARAMPAKVERRVRPGSAIALRDTANDQETVALVAFAIGNQEFCLPLAVVDEVLPIPDDIAPMPDADDVVIGSSAAGGAILPLLSLRALLCLPATDPDAARHTRPRILVARIGRHRVGLLVDDMRAILHVAEDAIDVVPQVLNRGKAEARIQAICRLDGGTRLVSVLAADQLLRQDITARLQGGSVSHEDVTPGAATRADEQFLVFRIGGEEYGLPIGAVDEVAPLPDKLTRLPGAPGFIQGLMNLRGQMIPVIDQVQRFGALPGAAGRRRVIVVQIGDLQAGFIVDAISEVAAIAAADLVPAPDLGNDHTRVFERVANLAGQQRIILIVSPRELLDRAEQDLLRNLGQKGAK